MLIHVKVKTEAKHESFEKRSETSLYISVKEPAKENKANKRVLEIVAEYFKISSKNISIVTGHHSPGKILEVNL